MKSHLLASAALGAVLLGWSGAALAADVAADAAVIEEIVVFGRGEARQVQTVSGEDIKLEVAGASPLKLVDKLPNVNLQSADALGGHEWSARVSIRGFDRNRLGFTLDGVPLGDMTYGNHNGLHISRAIAGENVGEVRVTQGAGALGVASANDLGGALEFKSRDPGAELGGLAVAGFGSDDTLRGFLRLESGELATGARAYLSYDYSTTDKWKGPAPQRHEHINFKAVQPLGKGSLSGWLNWSKRRETDYQDMSLEMIKRLGRNWDNYLPNYALAIQVAEIAHNRGDASPAGRFPSFGTVYPGKITSPDDAYYDSTGLRDDVIGALNLDMPVTDALTVKLTGYGHQNEGGGQWVTPFVVSPNYGVAGATSNDAPLSIRTTEYEIERYGLIGSAILTLGDHEIEAGFWAEDNDFLQSRRFYGVSRTVFDRDTLKTARNPFRTDWEYDFDTKTRKFYLSETWRPTEALTLNLGFKSLSVENSAKTIIGPNKTGVIKAEDNFQPKLGVSYDLTDDSQLFAGYSENMRAFPSSGTSGPFSASQAGFEAIKNKLKPELSKTFEAGWRYKTPTFQGVAAVYYVSFENRLFSVSQGSAIQGNPSALSNVGGVTAKGFEAVGEWNFTEDWSLFASYAYNDSTYDDDTRNGDGVVIARTGGKTTVDTPENLFKTELGYDNGALYGRMSLSYVSKRFFSYENDVNVPSHTVADLAVGYRFSGSPLLEGLEVQFNVANLFDEDYVATIDSNGFGIRGDNQTLQVAAPRQMFVTVRKAF
ncbi:TonB-dependent receptor [Caulobacter sp. NIBR2454]|uniref:TonB-dependent receptor n=1 Tax=Caulobacter sp. NIBR2454 TaxID=3015996 RepID=UPI0022B6843B|nr:TonB-dependent receptor [Caulobacter sp. NIBR2454]